MTAPSSTDDGGKDLHWEVVLAWKAKVNFGPGKFFMLLVIITLQLIMQVVMGNERHKKGNEKTFKQLA